jgi:hypothetical protein
MGIFVVFHFFKHLLPFFDTPANSTLASTTPGPIGWAGMPLSAA